MRLPGYFFTMRAARVRSYVQALPLAAVLLGFLVLPLLAILVVSFWDYDSVRVIPAFMLDNYRDVLGSAVTWRTYGNTLKYAALVWAVTLPLGFGIAYFLAFHVRTTAMQTALFLVCTVPFLTSNIIRMISWVPFLGRNGLVNGALMGMGLVDRPLEALLFSDFAVVLAFVHLYALFMVVPVFNSMMRIDRRLLEAARDAGATGAQVVWNVVIPLCRPWPGHRHGVRGHAGDGRLHHRAADGRGAAGVGGADDLQPDRAAAIPGGLRQRRRAARGRAADGRRHPAPGRRAAGAVAVARVLLGLLFGAFVLFLYGPILTIVVLAFGGSDSGLTFPMRGVSLHWFRQLLATQSVGDLGAALRRTAGLAVMVTVVTVCAALAAGLAFRRPFRGSGALFGLALSSLIVPSILVSLGVGLVFSQAGLDTAWWSSAFGAQLTWTLPFGLLITFAVLNRFDRSWEEAARDLGATPWQVFRLVMLPILAPSIVGIALFGFTLSWDEFPRTLLTAGSDNTLPLEIYGMTTNVTSPVLYALGAATTGVSLFVILVTLLTVRRLAARARPG